MAPTSALRTGFAIFPLIAAMLAPLAGLAQEAGDSTKQGKARRHDLGGATVIGLTKAQEASRQSYNITAIDAKKLYNTTLDISHALDRVSGIRVREDGGVGSNANLSLNGFTGRQVRFFLDGVPMENFGSAFQINNIPINLAERVEVYKGVVPIWLGSDALGGAVNIITSSKARSYLDVSYSYGSFNTHRSMINAGYTSKSGFSAQLNLFQNYSDNNYWVDVEAADLYTGKYYPNARVRRFNDRYRNETVVGSIGFVNKKWADQFMIGFTGGAFVKGIQSGARMDQSPFGQLHTRGTIMMPNIKYVKRDLFVKGLDLRINGNYNFGKEQIIDTAALRYNWFGDTKPSTRGERSLSLYEFSNHTALATANLSYALGTKHSFMLNHTYSSSDRIGSDPLEPTSVKFEQPQNNTKNVTGLGYKYDFNKAWSTSVFAKRLEQRTGYSMSYNPSGNWGDVAYLAQTNSLSATGYGIASSYYIIPTVQLKGSFERAYRFPEFTELFGDMINQEGNLKLRPEMSKNYNFGVTTQLNTGAAHRFNIAANFIYRDVSDFIRPTLNLNNTKQTTENRDRVTNTGFDAELRYSYGRLITAGVSMTYQDIRNQTEFESGSTAPSLLYRDRIPNMPYMFGNADASVFLKNVFGTGNNMSFGYNMLYVHSFYLYWPSLGQRAGKQDVPMQLTHDLNLTYTMQDGRYNIAVEARNILDARVYDNFSYQKPGRSFSVKLRYYFSKPIN